MTKVRYLDIPGKIRAAEQQGRLQQRLSFPAADP